MLDSTPMNESPINYQHLARDISLWAKDLGFSQIGICDVDLSAQEQPFLNWLEKGFHGGMHYMEKYGLMRTRPAELEQGTIRAISVRLDYLPQGAKFAETLANSKLAYISRYALGRDYHKLMRKRLQQLGEKIAEELKMSTVDFKFRAFVDSAPILERPLADKAQLGWTGKHTLLLNKESGSWFFLGELLVNIPLPTDQQEPHEESCGRCVACINICPTGAIVEPYLLDARRCISYFTIESAEAIPLELRPLMGNRIYGCDDCQLVCPWNKYAQLTKETDFQPRHGLDSATLVELLAWSEKEFLEKLEGSAIRRIGHQSWQRNIAVALGNAPYDVKIVEAIENCLDNANAFVSEHLTWALKQQYLQKDQANRNNPLTQRLINAINKQLPRDA